MITNYTMIQWVAYFLIYCFIGWCYESAYVSIKHKRWVNRGFMRGPFLPLYGSGAIVMLVVTIPFRDNLLLTFLAGCVGATTLEYVTGVCMEALFKIRYWDYSNRRFNFQGHICLAATLAWGAFTILMTRFIHTPIEHFVLGMPQIVVSIVTTLVTGVCIVDFTLSFRTALDIKDVLVKLEEVREEMERLQKRMDVILAFAEDSREQAVLNTYERLDELTDSLEARFAQIKELRTKLDERITQDIKGFSDELKERSENLKEDLREKSEDWKAKSEERKEEWKDRAEEYKEELEELRIKFRVVTEKRFQLLHRKDFFRRDMLLSNPMLKSRYFKNSLEDIKKAARDAAEEIRQKKRDKKK